MNAPAPVRHAERCNHSPQQAHTPLTAQWQWQQEASPQSAKPQHASCSTHYEQFPCQCVLTNKEPTWHTAPYQTPDINFNFNTTGHLLPTQSQQETPAGWPAAFSAPSHAGAAFAEASALPTLLP